MYTRIAFENYNNMCVPVMITIRMVLLYIHSCILDLVGHAVMVMWGYSTSNANTFCDFIYLL